MAIFTDLQSLLTAVAVGVLSLIIWKVISFYLQVRRYPPGPFPLPLVGNLLSFFRRPSLSFDFVIDDFAKEHGAIFTIWIGTQPNVCVMDPLFAHEVLRNKVFAGRPALSFAEDLKSRPGSVDIVFGDADRGWEVNRRLSYSAVRKYVANPVLSDHVVSAVDQVVDKLIFSRKEKFDVTDCVHDILILAISTAAFGDQYKLEDKEYLRLKDAFVTITSTNSPFFFLTNVSILKPLIDWWFRHILNANEYFKSHVAKKYQFHEDSFNSDSSNRDFTDALLWAKKQAELEGDVEGLKYIDRWNIMNNIGNLFFAGAETTRATLSWWFLCLALYQDWQEKVREEIESVFDNDEEIPCLDHRTRCNYIQAFTMEVLRMYPAARMAIPRKSFEDGVIGGHPIKKGTAILVSLSGPNRSEKVWDDPNSFKPERFLDKDGRIISRPNNYFFTFSSGARSCIGEKLAVANIFLITSRIIQKTKGFVFEVTPKPTDMKKLFDPDININFYKPAPYFLTLRKK